MKTEITYKGQKVDCYGEINEYMNVTIEGDYPNGMELSITDTGGHKTWTEAVKSIIDYFPEGTKIYELGAV